MLKTPMSTYLHYYWPTQNHVRNSITQKNEFQIVMILWITWIIMKSVLFNWLGPISRDIVVLSLLTTIQAIHMRDIILKW